MDKNLVAFLAVAKRCNLTEAAESLFLTQPTLTKRIANLELEMGTPLFHRMRRGMMLTDAGRVFYRRAIRIETEYKQCLEEVKTISSAGLSVLRVAAGPVFHLNWVAGLFSMLKAEFPTLKLELRTDISIDSGKMLNGGEIDLYLGIIPQDQIDELMYVKYLTSVEHGIILRKDNPLAKRATIDAADLVGYSWVSFLSDQETENRILEYSVPNGAKNSLIEIRTMSFATGLQLVSSGEFVMSAPLQLADIITKSGLAIRPARGGMPRRKAGLHLRKSSLGYGCIQAVIDYFDGIRFCE